MTAGRAAGFVALSVLVLAGWVTPVVVHACAGQEDSARDSFSRPLPGLAEDELQQFARGRAQFRTIRLSGERADGRGGLGPVFNRTSCSGCHVRNGRGRPPETGTAPLTSMVVRFGAGSSYGNQLNDKALPGLPPEGRASLGPGPEVTREVVGTVWTLNAARVVIRQANLGPLAPEVELSPRVAPHIAGVGLLEQIPEASLRARADPEDRDGDGVSGRAGRSLTGGFGRFGWRAELASVEEQVAQALHEDMGVTSALRPWPNCASAHAACLAQAGDAIEVGPAAFEALVSYVRNLAPPAARSTPAAAAGALAFSRIGCAACHVPEWRLSGGRVQVIHPYTDLLLHDLGPGLADRQVDGGVGSAEWRTAPLWGVGRIPEVNDHWRLLHDGRAQGLVEAILWHGGEAEFAREGFQALGTVDREALLAFLESL